MPAPDVAGAPAPLASCDAPTLRAALEGLGHPFGAARGYALAGLPRGAVPWVRACFAPDDELVLPEDPPLVQLGPVVLRAPAVGRHLVVFADPVPTAPRAVALAVVRRCAAGPRPLPAAVPRAWWALRASFCTITLTGPAGRGRVRAVAAADLRLEGDEFSGPAAGTGPSSASRRSPHAPPVRGRLSVAWRTAPGAPQAVFLAVDLAAWVA